MTLPDLISLLEAATEGSRELDCQIMAQVYDPPIMTRYGGMRGEEPIEYTPLSEIVAGGFGNWEGLALQAGAERFSTSVDSALSLIPEGWDWSISISGYGAARKFFGYVREVRPNWMTSDRRDAEGFCHHPHGAAMAICIAVLRARQAVGDQGGGGQ